jgi:hypothetical protein
MLADQPGVQDWYIPFKVTGCEKHPVTYKAVTIETITTRKTLPPTGKVVQSDRIRHVSEDAARCGHPNVAAFWPRAFMNYKMEPWGETTCEEAARKGYLEVLKWAHTNGCPWNKRTCEAAAEGGHLNVLEWARGNGCPWDDGTTAIAARAGHLKVLRWARANNCPWNATTCAAAAEGGHLEVLQWLRANNCPWDSSTCFAAARGGHLEVLQWARANKCPWGSCTCSAAAQGGHLEVLQWATTHGCPWDLLACGSAATYGHLEVLQWALAHGCPKTPFTCTRAAAHGHLEVLQWLRANGFPWDSATRGAASGGHLEILQWARANGAFWDSMRCLASAFTGLLVIDMEKWPSAHGTVPRHPQVAFWIVKTSKLTGFSEAALLLVAQAAAREDDVECFEMLRASWISQTTPLSAAPRCARLAQEAGVPLDPDSEKELQQVVDRQVITALTLSKSGIYRVLLLEIFRRADFFWVPA